MNNVLLVSPKKARAMDMSSPRCKLCGWSIEKVKVMGHHKQIALYKQGRCGAAKIANTLSQNMPEIKETHQAAKVCRATLPFVLGLCLTCHYCACTTKNITTQYT